MPTPHDGARGKGGFEGSTGVTGAPSMETDISHSVAFAHLESLVDEGEISEQRAVSLKTLFQALHTRVLEVYSNDNFLLQQARDMREQLDGVLTEIQVCMETAKNDDTEITQLKKNLASVEDALCRAQEDESVLQVEVLELERKKEIVGQDIEEAEAAEAARLRPQLERLENEVKKLTESIERAENEATTLRVKHDELLEREAALQREAEQRERQTTDVLRRIRIIEVEPTRISQHANLIEGALASAQRELKNATDRESTQQNTLTALDERYAVLERDEATANAKLERVKQELNAKLKMLATLSASLEAETEAGQSFQKRIQELNALIRATVEAGDSETAAIEKAARDKNLLLREFTAIGEETNGINMESIALEEEAKRVRQSINQMRARERDRQLETKRLKEQVALHTRTFIAEQRREGNFSKDADETIEVIDEVEVEIEDWEARAEAREKELTQLIGRREAMRREMNANSGRVNLARDELTGKETELRDVRQRFREMEKRVEDLVSMYQTVKKERSTKAAQIRAVSQRIAEMVEKARVLENELDVLYREAAQREETLTRLRREGDRTREVTKNLQAERNKHRLRVQELSERETMARVELENKVNTMSETEDAVVNARRAHENAITARNSAGTALMERNDELCMMYEQSNAQEAELHEKNRLFSELEDTKKHVLTQKRDLERQVVLCRNQLNSVRAAERALEETLGNIQAERETASALESEIMDPTNAKRWITVGQKKSDGARGSDVGGGGSPRDGVDHTSSTLGGSENSAGAAGSPPVPSESAVPNADLTAADLTAVTPDVLKLEEKRQEVEARLASVQERLMEKELVLNEVMELTQRLTEQVDDGRDIARAVGRRVNAYRADANVTSKRMMAVVSELSVAQSSSLQLREEVKHMESVLEDARLRMESNAPPSEIAEQLYKKERDRRARYAAVGRKADGGVSLDGSERAATSSGWTASSVDIPGRVKYGPPVRPNAYVPTDGLGIPIPFGSHAPLVPTVPAAAPTVFSRGLLPNQVPSKTV